MVREDYTAYTLENFSIVALNHSATAVCEIEVKLKVADKDERTVTMRWLYEGKEGETAMLPKGNGKWKLRNWNIFTFLR